MDELTKKQGIEKLPWIYNLFLTQDENFFPDAFMFRHLRFRLIFKKIEYPETKLLAYFHLTEEERVRFNLLFPLPETIYMYGGFNQITIHQMKSHGKIREMTNEEKRQFQTSLSERFAGKDIGDRLPLKPSPREKNCAQKLMKEGKYFCFEPMTYEHCSHVRV